MILALESPFRSSCFLSLSQEEWVAFAVSHCLVHEEQVLNERMSSMDC